MRPVEQIRVHLYREPVDFRKSINGLSAQIVEGLKLDPFSGEVFAFCSRGHDNILFNARPMISALARSA